MPTRLRLRVGDDGNETLCHTPSIAVAKYDAIGKKRGSGEVQGQPKGALQPLEEIPTERNYQGKRDETLFREKR